MTQPTDEQMRAYLDGEYGPPSTEATQIIQDELERGLRTPPAWCMCGVVDDTGDGFCGNCGLRVMTDENEPPTPTDRNEP